MSKKVAVLDNRFTKLDIDFTIDGYKFTVLGKDGPSMTEFQKIVSEYNSDMDDISKLKEADCFKNVENSLHYNIRRCARFHQITCIDKCFERCCIGFLNTVNDRESFTSGNLDKVAEQVKNHINDRDIDFTIDGYKFTVLGKDGPTFLYLPISLSD